MYTYDYDTTFIPAMPVVDVEIAPIGQTGKLTSRRAILDSGSEGSMIPLKILQQMNMRRIDQIAMRSITGSRSIVDIYQITLRIGPHTFPKVRVAADRYNPLMILGRDVLNQMVVVLNGLASATEIHE